MKTLRQLLSLVTGCILAAASPSGMHTGALASNPTQNPFAGTYCGDVGSPEVGLVTVNQLIVFNSGKVTGKWADGYGSIAGKVSASGDMELTFSITYAKGILGSAGRVTIKFQASAIVAKDVDGNLIGLWQWHNGTEPVALFLPRCE